MAVLHNGDNDDAAEDRKHRDELVEMFGDDFDLWLRELSREDDDKINSIRLTVTLHMPWTGGPFEDAADYVDDDGPAPARSKVSRTIQNIRAVNGAAKRVAFKFNCPFCNMPFRTGHAMMLHVKERHKRERDSSNVDARFGRDE